MNRKLSGTVPSCLAAAIVAVRTGASEPSPRKTEGAIFVYCAAAVRPPVSEIAMAFERETGIKVEITYANSGQLLGQIETTRTGDVYVPGDTGFIEKARQKKLVQGEPREFCHLVPALYVRKGNPLGIRELADLARPGVRLALADPSAALGPIQEELFRKNRISESALAKNLRVSPATANEVALAVKVGTVDAAIIWDAFRNFAPDDAEIVPIPPEKNVISTVGACVLSCTRNPDAATAFVNYLVSEKGRNILKAKGYAVGKPAAGENTEQ